jgi:hypothetical protein
MTKLKVLLGLSVLVAIGVVGSAALAAAPGVMTCSGGSIAPGTYKGVTVTGNCNFDGGAVTINGNLTVADGAILNDHAGTQADVHVTGNVKVGVGAVLGLGSYAPGPHNVATVDGNIVANQPLSLYLSRITVHGNVISNGGGDAERNLPIKDITVGGSLVIQGWHGLWFGVIRDTVGGNVIVTNNVAADTSVIPGIDSSEIVTNTVSGNLICQKNIPVAQVGDSEGATNTVSGNKIGECAGL